MKKILLSSILFVAFGSIQTKAQITIDSTNIVTVGEAVYQAVDTTLSITSIGPSGVNQTWNFSTLGTDRLDTLSFSVVNGQPLAASFPSANMVMTTTGPGMDSTWVYIDKNVNAMIVDGQATNINGVITAIPIPITLAVFPATYGMPPYSGTWNGTVFSIPLGIDPDGPGPLPMIDSVKVNRYTTYNGSIDAWGNVTTPLGTFASLRQNQTENNIDSTFTLSNGNWTLINPFVASLAGISQVAYDTVKTARWWTDNATARFPLVEFDYNPDGSINKASWLQASPVGVKENSVVSTPINLFPNPAKDLVTVDIKNSKASVIKIFDITGKSVKTISLNQSNRTISVIDMDNGIYFYNIFDNKGNIINTNKFVVAK